MTAVTKHDPRWVDSILDWKWTWFLARIALTGPYIVGGVTKFVDFQGAILEQRHFGLEPAPAWAVATIVVELLGPLLVITGRWVWLGAGALGVLTAVAAWAATPFWALHGHDQLIAVNGFTERLGLIAGFILAALLAEHAQRKA